MNQSIVTCTVPLDQLKLVNHSLSLSKFMLFQLDSDLQQGELRKASELLADIDDCMRRAQSMIVSWGLQFPAGG